MRDEDVLLVLDSLDETARKDLDETRRLIYGALAAATGRTKHWELVGTLTNALIHHSRLEFNSNPADVIDQLLDTITSYPSAYPDGRERWEQGKSRLLKHAAYITARLDGTETE